MKLLKLSFTPILLLLLSAQIKAAPIEVNFGTLDYYRDYQSGGSHTGETFADNFLFQVPETALELSVEVNTFGSKIKIVSGFELWHEEVLVYRDDGLTYSNGSYFIQDPIQPSYLPGYISSISGDYRLTVFGEDPFYLGGFYNVRVFANQNDAIPSSVPLPPSLALFLFGLISLFTIKNINFFRIRKYA